MVFDFLSECIDSLKCTGKVEIHMMYTDVWEARDVHIV